MTKQQIIENVRQLSREEQVDLARELWNLVDGGEGDCLLTDAQKQELDRRMAEHERAPGDARPWEQVREEIKRELRGV